MPPSRRILISAGPSPDNAPLVTGWRSVAAICTVTSSSNEGEAPALESTGAPSRHPALSLAGTPTTERTRTRSMPPAAASPLYTKCSSPATAMSSTNGVTDVLSHLALSVAALSDRCVERFSTKVSSTADATEFISHLSPPVAAPSGGRNSQSPDRTGHPPTVSRAENPAFQPPPACQAAGPVPNRRTWLAAALASRRALDHSYTRRSIQTANRTTKRGKGACS